MKELDLLFVEDLVYSDFFLITNRQKKSFIKLERLLTWNQNTILSVELLQLYTEFTLLIKLMKSLKLKNIRQIKKDKLAITSKTSDDVFVLIAYLKKYVKDYNVVVSELLRIKDIQKFDSLKLSLISFFACNEKLEKNLNLNKIFLMSVIDLDDKIRKESSFYKVYNKLDSFKKVLFFVAFLEYLFDRKEIYHV